MTIDKYPLVEYEGTDHSSYPAIVVVDSYGEGATLNVFTPTGLIVVTGVKESYRQYGDYPRNSWHRITQDIDIRL